MIISSMATMILFLLLALACWDVNGQSASIFDPATGLFTSVQATDPNNVQSTFIQFYRQRKGVDLSGTDFYLPYYFLANTPASDTTIVQTVSVASISSTFFDLLAIENIVPSQTQTSGNRVTLSYALTADLYEVKIRVTASTASPLPNQIRVLLNGVPVATVVRDINRIVEFTLLVRRAAGQFNTLAFEFGAIADRSFVDLTTPMIARRFDQFEQAVLIPFFVYGRPTSNLILNGLFDPSILNRVVGDTEIVTRASNYGAWTANGNIEVSKGKNYNSDYNTALFTARLEHANALNISQSISVPSANIYILTMIVTGAVRPQRLQAGSMFRVYWNDLLALELSMGNQVDSLFFVVRAEGINRLTLESANDLSNGGILVTDVSLSVMPNYSFTIV